MENQAFALIMAKLKEQDTKLDDLSDDMLEVKRSMSHYKGFVGGVLFVFATVWTAATFFWDRVKG